jgi:NMD protein affecting ribosome stability and mRNA decay
MTPNDQYNRTVAHLNMTDEVHTNCEECGAVIPVELTLCDDCTYAAEASEPEHDDSVKFCPNCGRPNQFGDLCISCQRDEQEAIDAGERWADEHEGNGYLPGTIGAETR